MIWALALHALAAEPLTADRDVPDYGRPAHTATPGEVMLWGPRVVLAPLWFTERYLVYEPVRAAAIYAERTNLPVRVLGLLTFESDRYRATVVPTALLDFGLRPSVGLLASGTFHRSGDPTLGLRGATGGSDWLLLSGRAGLSYTAEKSSQDVELVVGYLQRPDHVYRGFGDTRLDDTYRFTWTEIGADLEAVLTHHEHLELQVGAHGATHTFESRAVLDDPGLPLSEAPVGFDGYAAVALSTVVAIDSRRAVEPRSGARLQAAQRIGTEVDGDRRWWSGDAEAGVYLDVTGRRTVLGLRQYLAVTTPLGDGEVPFTEAQSLGGSQRMRGFLQGSFRGPTAWVSTAQLTWPIWPFADAFHFVEIGGVAGPRWPSPGQLSVSAGTGVALSQGPAGLAATVGIGTDSIADGARVTSARIAIGNQGAF